MSYDETPFERFNRFRFERERLETKRIPVTVVDEFGRSQPCDLEVRFDLVVESVTVRTGSTREVVVGFLVPDRDTGEPVRLAFTVGHLEHGFDAPPIEFSLREALRGMVCHEVDEAITRGGHRCYEPHQNGLLIVDPEPEPDPDPEP